MKSRRTIRVRISPDGGIVVEAHGFAGRGCEAATAAIEAALGKTETRVRKPEFRQPARASADSVQRLGGEEGA